MSLMLNAPVFPAYAPYFVRVTPSFAAPAGCTTIVAPRKGCLVSASITRPVIVPSCATPGTNATSIRAVASVTSFKGYLPE